MANLCGNNATSCWSNYGSYPVHRPYCHEMAVRILLACIQGHANRCDVYPSPSLPLHTPPSPTPLPPTPDPSPMLS